MSERKFIPTARPIIRGSMEAAILRDFALTNHGWAYPPGMREWMRRQPCVNDCGRPVSDMHHIFGSAGSLKSADVFTVPVCRQCHTVSEHDPIFRDVCMMAWMRLTARYIATVLQ